MKAFTVHEIFKIARFTDAPCTICLYMSVKPETTGTYQGTIHLPTNERPRTIQCILDTHAIFDNSSSQKPKVSISLKLKYKSRLQYVTPPIRVKCPAYLNPFRFIRVKPAKR